MPSSLDFVLIIGSILTVTAFGYGAYWALGIRRALAVRLYRNQALGVGLIAIGGEFVILFLGLTLTYDLQLLLARKFSLLWYAGSLSLIAFELVVFYYIDASILSSRKSDPLLRDTLGWRRLRILFWALLLCLIVAAVFLPYSSFYTNFSLIGIELGFSPFFPSLISGAIILPIAAHRSKDPTLRKNLIWFALFVSGVFLSTLPFTFLSNVLQEISGTYVLSLFAAYFLYRSARALVPLTRLSLELT
jgi:hypothetical protein